MARVHCAQILAELSPFQRERAALQMLRPGYMRKLLDLFRVRTGATKCTANPAPGLPCDAAAASRLACVPCRACRCHGQSGATSWAGVLVTRVFSRRKRGASGLVTACAWSSSPAPPAHVLQQCEDLEDAESLRALHGIVRGAVMLNDTSLLELLLAEGNVMDAVRRRARALGLQSWGF